MPAVATSTSKPAAPVALAFKPLDCMAYTAFESLVIGREPYAYTNRQKYIAQGGNLWMYLNFTIANPAGPFHQMLHQGRTDMGGGNSWGKAANLMDGKSLQRLEQVLTKLDADFPEVRRIEADDAGPDNDAVYGTFSAATRAELYDAQVEHAKLINQWCAQTGRIAVTNGLWRGDRGHGYPDPDRHGCDLYHVHFAESHGEEVGNPGSWWYVFMRDAQSGLKDSAGNNMGLWLPKSIATAKAAAALPFIAWTSAQTNYEQPSGAVTAVRLLGIPGTPGSPPPEPPPTTPPPTTPPPPPSIPSKPARPALPVIALGDAFVKVTRPTMTDGADKWQVYVDSKNGAPSRLDLTGAEAMLDHAIGETHTYRVGISRGTAYSDWSDPVSIVMVAPEPDPDPPADPCAPLREQLAAVTAERDAALAKLTQVRSGVAAAASEFATKLADELE